MLGFVYPNEISKALVARQLSFPVNRLPSTVHRSKQKRLISFVRMKLLKRP